MSKGEEAEAEPAHSSCPAYDELLKVLEDGAVKKEKKKTFFFKPVFLSHP